jgi:hypothetical protein
MSALGLPYVAIALAGVFCLAAIGEGDAEAVTNKCANQWKAAKANGATGGKTWKEFFEQCSVDQMGVSRGLTISPAASAPEPAASPPATPAVAPNPAPAAAAPAPATTAASAAIPADPAPVAATAPVPAKKPKSMESVAARGKFANEADAKAKCPSDVVVWVDAASKKFRPAGHDGASKSKKGAYMCEADATAAGARASKSEKQL